MTALSMTRGDDESFDVVVKTKAGVVVDITGMDLRFTAKRRVSDTDAQAVISKTTGAGITTTSAVNGAARIDVEAADTTALTATTRLTWDLQGTDETGTVRTLARGGLRIEADVSRTTP
jgi:carbon monoxide dehydrogenase subunit G